MAGDQNSGNKRASDGEPMASGVVPAAAPAGSSARASDTPERAAAASDFMTRAEVAELLRCSEPHVVALVERDKLPAFRLGKLWRFRRSEVLAWCERGSHGRRSA